MQLNPHYAELNESYLFSTIAHKVADYQKAHACLIRTDSLMLAPLAKMRSSP